MSRYRLTPTPEQEQSLLGHCAHARYVWNLGLEQRLEWRPGRGPAPGYAKQDRQLTEARTAEPWLAAGSSTVQQQALRDLDQAWRNFFAGTHRKPTWRKQGRNEGFRVVGAQASRVETLNRIDRGVAVTLTVSDGTTYRAPIPRSVATVQRQLSRAKLGSNRRKRAKQALARLHSRNADARKDWAEKASTDIARRFDVIRIEELRVRNMTRSSRGTAANPGRNVRQKSGLNRSILQQGRSLFACRLEDKAAGRVEKVNPAYTSQACSRCTVVDREARESQAVFRCRSCGYCGNADVNAARNIAAGHAVTARGGPELPGPTNREPQLALPAS
jgi:putative transposase